MKATLSIALVVAALTAEAQINLPTLSYSQNFNSLGSASATWTDNSTLTGWYASVSNATTGTVGPYTTAYSVGSGGGTSSSTLYALGLSGDTERALGGAPSSTALGVLGMRLINTSGGIFDDLQIKFDVEQWSDRGTSRVSLSYQVFSPGGGNLATLGGWIDLGSVDSPLPQGPGPTYATGIGNTTGLAANNTYGISSLNWQDGDELWFKWTISKLGGNNCTHGIDNLIIAVPEPSVAVLAGLGFLLTIHRLRRRK